MSVLYILATGLVGLATGFLVGLSRSPVVATIIPLLFGLVAGVGGLLVSGKYEDTAKQKNYNDFVAFCIIAFIICNVLGTGFFLWKFRLDLEPDLTAVPGFSDFEAQKQLGLAELRVRAVLLGMSEAERKALLEKYAKAPSSETKVAAIDDVHRNVDLIISLATDDKIAKLTKDHKTVIISALSYLRPISKIAEYLKSTFTLSQSSQKGGLDENVVAWIMYGVRDHFLDTLIKSYGDIHNFATNENTSDAVINDAGIPLDLLASILALDSALDAAANALSDNGKRSRSYAPLSDDLIKAFNDLPASAKSAAAEEFAVPTSGPALGGHSR